MIRRLGLSSLEVSAYTCPLSGPDACRTDHWGSNFGVFCIKPTQEAWDFLWEILWTGTLPFQA